MNQLPAGLKHFIHGPQAMDRLFYQHVNQTNAVQHI